MKLYSLLPKNGDEVTVHDAVYDTEFYFYRNSSGSLWDKTMLRLSKLLDVAGTHQSPHGLHVDVNLSRLIESHLNETEELFIHNDIDSIMYDMDNILAGYVSEEWLFEFVRVLSRKGVKK